MPKITGQDLYERIVLIQDIIDALRKGLQETNGRLVKLIEIMAHKFPEDDQLETLAGPPL